LRQSIKKGAKSVLRPLKKLKRTLSKRSQSSVDDSPIDIPSHATSTEPSQVIELSDDDPDPEKELGESKYHFTILFCTDDDSEKLKRTWRSPIYSFFKSDVSIQQHEGRPCHFFRCAARKCKTALGGVRRFQDSQDKSSTANLKHHAVRCFGEDAVKTATKPKHAGNENGSIFSLFARQGQQPVQYSHRSHSNPEVRYVYLTCCYVFIHLYPIHRARLVKWIAENNRPANIINDAELHNLLTAGRPHISIPSSTTLSRNVNASFERCRERISQLLKV
jgi:hypothetical protein